MLALSTLDFQATRYPAIVVAFPPVLAGSVHVRLMEDEVDASGSGLSTSGLMNAINPC